MKLKLRPVLLLPFMLLAACSHQADPSFTGSLCSLDPGLDGIIAPGTRPEILAEGFAWSEGPLWIPEENALLFSDIPKNTIFRWDEESGLQHYLHPSGYTDTIPRGGETGSNGLLLNEKGALVLCQHGDRRISVMDAPVRNPAPSYISLTENWKGKRFNSPNDGVFSKRGSLYFTDPAYGMELGFEDPGRELAFAGVYQLDRGGQAEMLIDTLSAPNGIGLSPDESRLYVAVSGGASGQIWMEYQLNKRGHPLTGKLFYDAGPASDSLKGAPDGMDIRSDGIIFATGPGGTWVFRPDGTPLGIILTGQLTSNCTLDAKEEYLYMTCDMYLMRIKLLN